MDLINSFLAGVVLLLIVGYLALRHLREGMGTWASDEEFDDPELLYREDADLIPSQEQGNIRGSSKEDENEAEDAEEPSGREEDPSQH